MVPKQTPVPGRMTICVQLWDGFSDCCDLKVNLETESRHTGTLSFLGGNCRVPEEEL